MYPCSKEVLHKNFPSPDGSSDFKGTQELHEFENAFSGEGRRGSHREPGDLSPQDANRCRHHPTGRGDFLPGVLLSPGASTPKDKAI